jgi:hypothetical protein
MSPKKVRKGIYCRVRSIVVDPIRKVTEDAFSLRHAVCPQCGQTISRNPLTGRAKKHRVILR